MFCAYCGARLEDGSMFCSNCGSKVVEVIVTKDQLSVAEEWEETSPRETDEKDQDTYGTNSDHDQEEVDEQNIEVAKDRESSADLVEQTVDTPQDEKSQVEQAVDTPQEQEAQVEQAVDKPQEQESQVEQAVDKPQEQVFQVEQTVDTPQEQLIQVEQPAETLQEQSSQAVKSVTTSQDQFIQQDQFVEMFESQENEPVIEMIVCMICGAPLERDSVFCPNCGHRVGAEPGKPQEPSSISSHTVQPYYAAPDETPQMDPIGSGYPNQAPQLPNFRSPHHKQRKVNKSTETVGGKKKKKGLLTATIMFAVLVLGALGFFLYSKITLGKLGDSVEAFKSLAAEKGLEDYEEFATIIKDAEEKAAGWVLFGASDIEKKLNEATIDCQQLSQALIDLMDQRSNYENLSQSLIMESIQENIIHAYLNEFDAALTAANKEQAEEILAELESVKRSLITDNKIYLDSLLTELSNYENPDFSEADWDLFYNEITMVQNYIIASEFVKAKDQILNCSASIASMEERIAEEKEAAAIALLHAKPEILTIMIPDIIYDDYSYRTEFEQALEAELKIDIVFLQFDLESYDTAVSTMLAAGELPEVVYLSQDRYKDFQSQGVLTDITEYWYESNLLTSPNYYGEEAMERLKIDGRLYGFTPMRGKTYVTYIRQSWLDEYGLSVPTTYDEFSQMLETFTENKMGQSATYGITAPGFLTNNEPYISYLQPFYQKAVAEIYQASNGDWVDGFTQPEMVDALYRLQDAYNQGFLDPGMADRTVADAIREFGSGKCGVISLVEGEGADYLINELKKNRIEDDIVVMEPLDDMGSYIGSEPAVFAITTSCVNPGGVMKYFFEPMLDGDVVQTLWTYGVEGYHWTTAETTLFEEVIGFGNMENQLVTLPYAGKNEITYNYNLINPLQSLATFEGTDPGISMISDLAAISASIANQYYEASSNVKYNQTYWNNFGAVYLARVEAVNKVILEGVDPVVALEEYQSDVQYIMDQVLSEMNQD